MLYHIYEMNHAALAPMRAAANAGRFFWKNPLNPLAETPFAKVTAAGAAVGLVGSLAAGRLLSGILYGVTPGDPAALAGALACLTGAGLAAAYWPARRAAGVSPAEALRHEMFAAAENLDFERAARLRDQLKELRTKHGDIVSSPRGGKKKKKKQRTKK